MISKNILAFDMGSSNGRAMLGRFDGERIRLDELYRFSNEPVTILGSIHWDILRLFRDLNEGLKKYSAKYNEPLLSLAIDTWGVDHGLLDSKGFLIGNPFHYRDSRNDDIVDRISGILPQEQVFKLTGNHISSHNTLYQLMSTKYKQPGVWDRIDCVLMLPDLLEYFLTGEKGTEFTIATTMQLLGTDRMDWCKELLEILDIPGDFFPPLEKPGTVRGTLRREIGGNAGIGTVPVVAASSHDTASAVAAIPELDEDTAFISSGSWSIVGVETDKIYTGENVYKWGFTNEGGVGGKCQLLKNTTGMWLIQDCVREWNRSGDKTDFEELVELARVSTPFRSFIDPDHSLFSMPGGMPERIRSYCGSSGQKVPETKGEIARCIFESLALKHRFCIEKLETILDRPLKALRVVGGGSQNDLLSQFTANAIQKPVYCGPVEATALGNIMVQAMAFGLVENLQDIRKIIGNSFKIKCYEPRDREEWEAAYGRFVSLISNNEKTAGKERQA